MGGLLFVTLCLKSNRPNRIIQEAKDETCHSFAACSEASFAKCFILSASTSKPREE